MRAGFNGLFTGVALCVLAILGATSAVAQADREKPPRVSDAPLTSEQLAIYKAVLGEWAEGNRAAINLSMLTRPMEGSESEDTRDCFKGHAFEGAVPNLVHRIRNEELGSLGNLRLRLVDPEQHAKEVEANDPEHALQEHRDIDKAVDNAFSHGLFTLGEIQFDKSHTYAFVSFSFWCGMLCGHGNSWLMKKSEGNWRRIKMCGGWVS